MPQIHDPNLPPDDLTCFVSVIARLNRLHHAAPVDDQLRQFTFDAAVSLSRVIQLLDEPAKKA